MINLKKQDPIADAVKEILQQEALKGNQHKIDKNKNNKIDAEDFKLLRKEENVDEALKGNQHKIDKNKNNKIDAEDFKILRKEETVEEGIKDIAKKAFKALTGGSDEDHLKSLQKRMGLPQTGKKPEPQKEEVEQIEELNKSTLSSYVKKANQSTRDAAMNLGYKAGRKEGGAEFTGTLAKRRTGIERASDKLAKEEVEQIDELSKSTLGSYVKKATSDAVVSRKIGTDFEHRASRAKSTSTKDASNRLSDRFNDMSKKRQSGVGKAVERLTKEEIMPKTLKQFKENAFDWKKKPEPTPNGGSGVKQGSRYGGSKQKDVPEKDTDEKK